MASGSLREKAHFEVKGDVRGPQRRREEMVVLGLSSEEVALEVFRGTLGF